MKIRDPTKVPRPKKSRKCNGPRLVVFANAIFQWYGLMRFLDFEQKGHEGGNCFVFVIIGFRRPGPCLFLCLTFGAG